MIITAEADRQDFGVLQQNLGDNNRDFGVAEDRLYYGD